eukprot:g3245.t1
MSSKLDILARYGGAAAGPPGSSTDFKERKKSKKDKAAAIKPERQMIKIRDAGDDEVVIKGPKRRKLREEELDLDYQRGDVQVVDSAELGRKDSSDSDASPPRERAGSARHEGSPKSGSPRTKPTTTNNDKANEKDDEQQSEEKIGNARAGIMTLEEIRAANQEREKKKQIELERARELHAQNAEKNQTVYRNALGQIVSAEQYKKEQEKKKRKEYQRQDASKWGRGLAQEKALQERRAMEEKIVKEESFARFEIGKDVQEANKARDRWDDPLSQFDAENQKAGKSSPSSRAAAAPKPKCKFAMPTNRWNIPPGYRWDGKIRGVGFEEKVLAAMNDAQAYQDAKDLFERHDW